MRCPKCGFISFDHLSSCAKCGKDIAEVASELQGTSIKVETPMFLSGALATYADREESFEDHAMDVDLEGGIDFAMDDAAVAEEAVDTASAEEDIDFSMEDEADVSMAAGEEEGAAVIEIEDDEAVDFTLEAEAEEEAEPVTMEKSFEELDFMGPVDDEEEGGLEFDLEDFIEDMNDDKKK